MTAFFLVAVGACGVCFLAGWLLATWRAERRRPVDNRPRPRTGAAGRGPGRAHHWPGHPVPRPPLAARTDDPTRVITRLITPSPEARRRNPLFDTTEIRPGGRAS